jgi:signal transduction histidine kinase
LSGLVTLRRHPILIALALCVTAATLSGAQGESIRRVRELASLAPGRAVTVRGTVTRSRAGRSFSLSDPSGSIFAYTDAMDPLDPGDIVEASGEAAIDPDGAPSIAHTTYRVIGHGPQPVPTPVTIAEVEDGSHDAALVSVEAVLQRVETARYEYGLVLASDEQEFTAWLLRESAGRVPQIPRGSRLRIIGVVSRTDDPDGRGGYELLMRDSADAIVLASPPWWMSRHIPAFAAAFAGVSIILLSYAFLLRRQVRQQTAVLAEHLRAEADLQEQYRQAQKMEAVGRLAGGIAHDFNNIMTVVLGHAEVLALELKGHEDLLESVTEIRKAAERAASVTRQLLAFGRRQWLEISAVDLNDVIGSMTTLLKRVLGGDIEVRAEPAPAPVVVTIDRGQLEQALLNLAVNARDAMPGGGRLSLSAAVEWRDGADVAVLRVRDTGTGIPADVQPHVFEPFYTTKDVGQGSGLGLAMVYGFVRQTGGTIHFDTAEGRGTTFELTFPLAAARAHERV